jgi:hypothetical protein
MPPTNERILAPTWPSVAGKTAETAGDVAAPEWPCPELDCGAITKSPALLADHLADAHNWSDRELELWWSGDR